MKRLATVILAALLFSGCYGYTVVSAVDEPAPVVYPYFWPYWYGYGWHSGYYPGYRIYPRPHYHYTVPLAPLKVHPAPARGLHRVPGNHR